MVEFNKDKIPQYKMGLHIAQIVLSVTIWCLEIAVFKGGNIYGQNGWTFGVVRTPLISQSPVSTLLLTPSRSASFACQHGFT